MRPSLPHILFVVSRLPGMSFVARLRVLRPARSATLPPTGRCSMTEPEPEPDRERERLLRWRREVLSRAGFSEMYVEMLSFADCDLHQAVELKKKGCHDELVARIVL